MQVPYISHNRDIVFRLMPEIISCDPLKFSELQEEYEHIALLI